MNESILSRALAPIKNRILGMIVRGLLDSVDDSEGIQLVKIQGLADETRTDVERLQNYGVTSVPPKGSKLLLVCVGASRDQIICLAADDEASRRKGMQPGEVALYNSATGAEVFLNASVRLGAEDADDPVVRKSDLQAFIDVYNTHTHAVTGTCPSGGGALTAGTAIATTGTGTASGSSKVFSK